MARANLNTVHARNREQLWRLNARQRSAANPDRLAQRINRRLANEGYVGEIIAKRFVTGGGSSGAPWSPLKSATIQQRARLGFGSAPILVRSGRLQRGATQGRVSATADEIRLEFKDGAAPRYICGGRSRAKKVNVAARAAAKFFGVAFGSGALSDYAGALNRKRPFYGPPTAQELAPLLHRRDALIAQVQQAIAQGGSLSTFI